MTKTDDAKISPAKGEDFTCVTFHPDLSKFKMEKLDKDIVDLFTRRAYDVVASTRGVKVILNGVRLPVSNSSLSHLSDLSVCCLIPSHKVQVHISVLLVSCFNYSFSITGSLVD